MQEELKQARKAFDVDEDLKQTLGNNDWSFFLTDQASFGWSVFTF